MGWKENLEQNKIANKNIRASKNINANKKTKQSKNINANKKTMQIKNQGIKKNDVDQIDLHHYFFL